MYKSFTDAGNAAVKTACKLAEKNGSVYAEQRYRELFKETIDEFYNDYTPIDGGYDRTYSLYNILIVNKDKDGRMSTLGFDESAMTTFRSKYINGSDDPKDGLYYQVFVQGWHGGADKDNVNNNHPDPGKPYWRTPIPKFDAWGGPAKIADESPYDAFHRKVDDARHEGGDVYTYCDNLAHGYFNLEFPKEFLKRVR